VISDLTTEFDQLVKRLEKLRTVLLQEQPALWIPLNTIEQQATTQRQFLADLICDLWYRDGQDGRETRSRHGLVMANADLCEHIKDINQQKDRFRQAVQQARAELITDDWQQHYTQLGQRHASLRESLTFAGLKRVHLKQCFRHIPLLESCPKKVGFSWYVNGRSIKKISVAQAQEMLLELGEEKSHIQVQLKKLAHLSEHLQLAQIQTLAPVVRANLVFDPASAIKRKAMNLALPLFIPGEGAQLPVFNEISSEPPVGRTRQQRGDQKISAEPFLPSLRIHTYRA